jgi:hypothetical protein
MIAYVGIRAYKVSLYASLALCYNPAHDSDSIIESINSRAKRPCRDNMFMSEYDIARMNRLYDRFITTFKDTYKEIGEK